MRYTKKKKLAVAFIILFCFFISGSFYLLFTAKGFSVLTEFALSRYFDSKAVSIRNAEGIVGEDFVLQDIEIENLKKLPAGTVLKIQKLTAGTAGLGLDRVSLKIVNGKLVLPQSEPVLFYGSCSDGQFDLKVYSREMDIRQVFDMFAGAASLKEFSGVIRDIDARLTGSFSEPRIEGALLLKRFDTEKVSIKNAPAKFDFTLKDLQDELKLYGQAVFASGSINASKSVIEVEEGRMTFSGDFRKPVFDVRGKAVVGDTEISVIFKGDIKKPYFRLTSFPPAPQAKLLLILLTGKSWRTTEKALEAGQITSEIAGDFIDFFLFGGAAEKIAGHLGVDSVKITADGKNKGVGFEKAISDKTSLGYAVKQSGEKETDALTTQKVAAERKITDKVSIEAEKEFKSVDKNGSQSDEALTDDKVMLKYKKKF